MTGSIALAHRISRSSRLQSISSCSRGLASWSPFDLPTAWDPYQPTHRSHIDALPEVRAVQRLLDTLNQKASGTGPSLPSTTSTTGYTHTMTPEQYLTCLDAAMATFSLQVHARIAALVGQGFYTIGPCGEELLAPAGLTFEDYDSTALHYRHTAMSVARMLNSGMQAGEDKEQLLMDGLLARARGYTVSKNDPVTGGVHCSIGGASNEYLVTSTLSSQCPTAVGRALGYSLLPSSKERSMSFVTIGDGSMHNHHFLSAFTLARHAKHLNVKCPVVFGISNNGLSISYSTKDYVDTVFPDDRVDPLVPVFRADGQDMMDVYDKTMQASAYARKNQSPCVLMYSNMVRRFGHAATDRQNAYLDEEKIQEMADTWALESAMKQAVEELNLITYEELHDRFSYIHYKADDAFAQAIQEPKVNLEDMMGRVSVPLATIPPKTEAKSEEGTKKGRRQVMRKQMTRLYDELLGTDPSIVYLGEDVRHGGYYLVTEGLADKYPTRVLDFPPDETTLMGAALGFSQIGLTPIVEIPYAKYLDCGVDMFYEIAIQHWLTSAPGKDEEEKKKQGMVVRLQGFDRGVFGGNFHTHNMLNHMPPGVDVVCYSNGEDYVKGLRHAVLQAKAGRVVMVVDCTHLLNLRHLHDRDRLWEGTYPTDTEEMMGFDEVRRYRASEEGSAKIAIVSYGNGVVTSLQARKDLVDHGVLGAEAELDIIDCPYLSGVPTGLEEALKDYDQVLFADICKEGPGSNVFSSMIMELQQKGSLPGTWKFVGAPRTYNPLGSTVTFLNRDTIENAVVDMLGSK